MQRPPVIHYQLKFAVGKSIYGYHMTLSDEKSLQFCEDLSPAFSRGVLWSSPLPRAVVFNRGVKGNNSHDGLARFGDLVAQLLLVPRGVRLGIVL